MGEYNEIPEELLPKTLTNDSFEVKNYNGSSYAYYNITTPFHRKCTIASTP